MGSCCQGYQINEKENQEEDKNIEQAFITNTLQKEPEQNLGDLQQIQGDVQQNEDDRKKEDEDKKEKCYQELSENERKQFNTTGNLQESLHQQLKKRSSIPVSSNFIFTPSLLVRRQTLDIQIINHYTMGPLLGEGGFGKVYKIIHKQTGAIRAAKVIKRCTLNPENEAQLLHETEILKNIDHPNIVKMFEIFVDQKNYYIVTEYCLGGELFQRIRTITNYSEKFTSIYMKQILSAVMYCHQRNIVHRDLKVFHPHKNILFDAKKADSNLKVIDFGASTKIIGNQGLTKRIGTPFYIAPEVLDADTGYDEKCDVWSIGVILFMLLIGRPPFYGSTDSETLELVCKGEYKIEAKISDLAQDLISKMLIVDPKKRISVEEAYQHPFIQKSSQDDTVMNHKIIEKLQQFEARNKLRAAIQQFIVVQVMNEGEQAELLRTFKELDKNGDGTLSRKELLEGFLKIYQDEMRAISIVDQVLAEVDVNKSGQVDFVEFLSAAMNLDKNSTQKKVRKAFKLFDLDGDGYIIKNELEEIFGNIPIDDMAWKDVLNSCDKNKDDKIDENEFLELLHQKK